MAPDFRSIRGRARGLISAGSAVFLAAAILGGAFISAGAQATPGDLDLTFSGDGKQTTDFGIGGTSAAAATVRQPDGEIVAVGTGQGPNQSTDFARPLSGELSHPPLSPAGKTIIHRAQ